ncbi:MAG: hypothetical protein EZS28_004551 [Streblomastix strix]|uniref:Reverse transcriptase domain-containing protein n=1 Tax=Streblomastix strix TaxID=222440 RepID=A0A5J4WZG2_9EUKA|nr:MAG: hypothetical protein EZS28_004551 [Streblomastix strix]
MEDQRTLRDNLQHNDLVSTLGLKSAYLHVPMAEESSKYFGFKYNNQYYRQKTLCFGHTSAPHIFIQLMRLIISQLRPRIRTVSYLGDFAFLFTTESEALAGIKEIILLFRKLGLTIEWNKSNLIPSHQFTYLGFDWDTSKMIVSPSKKRIQKATNKVSQRLKKELLLWENRLLLDFALSIIPFHQDATLTTDASQDVKFSFMSIAWALPRLIDFFYSLEVIQHYVSFFEYHLLFLFCIIINYFDSNNSFVLLFPSCIKLFQIHLFQVS